MLGVDVFGQLEPWGKRIFGRVQVRVGGPVGASADLCLRGAAFGLGPEDQGPGLLAVGLRWS